MNKVYLLLGSNLSDPVIQLKKAHTYIRKRIGTITRQSNLYQTAPWGRKGQPDFLNQVIVVETESAPETVMELILAIEKDMGRIRTKKNAPRIIDIDILFYNKQIIHSSKLTIPHASLHKRMFVLVPLNELSPLLVHPELDKSVHTLLKECGDKLSVKKIS
jgi:2-amino-4-hydroxy-6-hydroxymethyldihydropteridine diphosphokinase